MLQFPPDVTFLIEVCSFGVFLFLMKRWFFGPVSEVLERRMGRRVGMVGEAERLRGEAGELERRVQGELGETRRRAVSLCAEIRQAGEREERALLEDARERVEGRLEAVRAEVGREMAEARQHVPGEAGKLAERIVARMITGSGE